MLVQTLKIQMGIYLLIAVFLYKRTQFSLNDINNQLIDHNDSFLITFRNLILARFIKLYFTLLMLKKEKIKLNQFKEFVFKS